MKARDIASVALLLGSIGLVGLIALRVRGWRPQERSMQDRDDYTRPGLRDKEVTIPGRPHHIPEFLQDPESIERKVTFHFSTNAWGLRGAEVPLVKPEGGLRIVAVGECVTFGNGVDDDEAYPYQLEVALRARLPDRPVEVINGGINVEARQILERFERVMLPMEPDIVIFGPGGTSVFDPAHIGTAPARNWLDQAEYDRMLKDYNAVLERMVRLSEVQGFELLLVAPAFNSFFLPDGQLFVDAVNEFGAAHGIPTVDPVAMFAAIERQDGLMLERSEGWQRLVRYQAGVPEVLLEVQGVHEQEMHIEPEVYAWLDDHPEVSLRLSIDGNHPNPEGHRLIAAELLRLLEGEGLIPAGP
jgi:hypothetical protein